MFELVAENSVLRILLLMLLFAVVAAIVYFAGQSIGARQLTRARILDSAGGIGATKALGSLRTDRVESSWLKLVNSIEKRGLSLVDTKDAALRHKLVAAGFAAPYAPRV